MVTTATTVIVVADTVTAATAILATASMVITVIAVGIAVMDMGIGAAEMDTMAILATADTVMVTVIMATVVGITVTMDTVIGVADMVIGAILATVDTVMVITATVVGITVTTDTVIGVADTVMVTTVIAVGIMVTTASPPRMNMASPVTAIGGSSPKTGDIAAGDQGQQALPRRCGVAATGAIARWGLRAENGDSTSAKVTSLRGHTLLATEASRVDPRGVVLKVEGQKVGPDATAGTRTIAVARAHQIASRRWNTSWMPC
jgi:hypothetical protein